MQVIREDTLNPSEEEAVEANKSDVLTPISSRPHHIRMRSS